MPAGRPVEYDKQAVLLKLCLYMAEGKRTLDQICTQEKDMPDRSSIYMWCAQDDKLFDIFRKAQRLWALAQADEMIKIAEDQSRDISPDGKSDNTAVNRDKLRIGTRQWSMQRFHPDLFGDKIKQEVTGADGAPFTPILNINLKKD